MDGVVAGMLGCRVGVDLRAGLQQKKGVNGRERQAGDGFLFLLCEELLDV